MGESFESWGKKRKRRSAFLDDSEAPVDPNMRLSREIIVLDYGDEKTNPFDTFERVRAEQQDQPESPHGNKTDYHAQPVDWNDEGYTNEATFSRTPVVDLTTYLTHDEIDGGGTCPTRTSVLGLAVTTTLLIVVYVCTAMVYCIRRSVRNSGSKDAMDYMR